MKKNKMMRIASVLLVAVLLTTSIISGTFAKYVTEGSVSDLARVAKFGVVVSAENDLFSKTYALDDTDAEDDEDGFSVVSTEKVVAPGTKSDDANPFKITVTGTPEVDVIVTIKIDDCKDVWLQQGWFSDPTGAGENFYNASVYYPVVFTLKQGDNELKSGTLAEIKAYLENEAEPIYIEAGNDLSEYMYTLSWAWDFDDDGDGTYDKQDTLLGDIAAARTEGATSVVVGGQTLTEGGQYNIDTSVKFTVTVTQVD